MSINIERSRTAPNGQKIPFLEYIPADTDHSCIIFLHGIGERGNPDGSNLSSLKAGNSGWITNIAERGLIPTVNRSIILSPQLNSGYGDWQDWYVSEMLSYAKTMLGADPLKIGLCGLSLGGGGVWNAVANPNIAGQLAWIAPVCGTNRYNSATGNNIKSNNIATWIFHSADDSRVGVFGSDNAYNNLKNLGVSVIYSRYANFNHECWDEAFNPGHPDYALTPPGLQKQTQVNVYEWSQLQQRGTAPVPIPGTDPTHNLPPPIIVFGPATETVEADVSTGLAKFTADASGSQKVLAYPQYSDAYKWGFETIVAGSWNTPAEPTGQQGGPKKTWSNLKPGLYRVTLTVRGENGGTVTTQKDVRVVKGNPTPGLLKVTGLKLSDGSEYIFIKEAESVMIRYKDNTSEVR